jgi:predicted small metal-binding protein
MKHVTCSCGYVASGETADELLTAVEAHIDASHGAGSMSEVEGHAMRDPTREPRSEEER